MVIIHIYLLYGSNQDFLGHFWFFDTFFFLIKVADDQIMYTKCYRREKIFLCYFKINPRKLVKIGR